MSGLFLIGFGIFALVLTGALPSGSSYADDVQFFPRIIGASIVLVGLAVFIPDAIRYYRSGRFATGDRWVLRPLACLVMGTLAFAILMKPLGFAATAATSAFVGSFAAPFPSFRHRVAVAVTVSVLASIVFIVALGINFPLWPAGF